MTAIAAGFIGESRVHCWLLGQLTYEEMLTAFRKVYDEADIVCGHFIRKHDLPILNGAMAEAGLPPLGPKLVSDTCLDLVKSKDISRSQENLAEMLGLSESKAHMSNASWREANRLTPAGLSKTRARVVGDVKQNMAIRSALIERGLLKTPRVWRP